MSTNQHLQAEILAAMADLAGDTEPSLEAVVRAKHVALQAQLAAMGADLERLQQEQDARHEAKEHLRMIRARITMAECVAEHRAEEARKADLAKRIEHDRLNPSRWSGPGYDMLPDGTRFEATQITLPRRSPNSTSTSDSPAVGEPNLYGVNVPEPQHEGTVEDHRRRLLGPKLGEA
jgi:hypothetical protein